MQPGAYSHHLSLSHSRTFTHSISHISQAMPPESIPALAADLRRAVRETAPRPLAATAAAPAAPSGNNDGCNNGSDAALEQWLAGGNPFTDGRRASDQVRDPPPLFPTHLCEASRVQFRTRIAGHSPSGETRCISIYSTGGEVRARGKRCPVSGVEYILCVTRVVECDAELGNCDANFSAGNDVCAGFTSESCASPAKSHARVL